MQAELKNEIDGIEKFFHEMQQVNIDISKNILTYNGFHSAKLYTVFLQKNYMLFNTNLYVNLSGITDKTERVNYLKNLKRHLTELDEELLQTRDTVVILQSMLIEGKNWRSIIPQLKEMKVNITEDALLKELEEIDILSFIDSQIGYSYKAISLVYDIITLELGVPSSYGLNPVLPTYKLRWKGSMRQLTELFIELQRKEWISTIEDKRIEPAVRNIVSLFDIQRTRLPEEEQEYQSMSEILKGTISELGKRHHQRLYSEHYQPVFNKIKKNKSL
ncbi:hypothetical protein C3K47_18825 [Solitalea longa]|uniref:Uncharacterized protein n=1 Tax=Solitalea longa TaxID=2079460 RepID=A0A2S4ZXP8_9SPHI|nr:hypothetical protein [Solitalea longa]POY34692.1 hypothetical protein C3K47_18825 [Solitalea longa]